MGLGPNQACYNQHILHIANTVEHYPLPDLHSALIKTDGCNVTASPDPNIQIPVLDVPAILQGDYSHRMQEGLLSIYPKSGIQSLDRAATLALRFPVGYPLRDVDVMLGAPSTGGNAVTCQGLTANTLRLSSYNGPVVLRDARVCGMLSLGATLDGEVRLERVQADEGPVYIRSVFGNVWIDRLVTAGLAQVRIRGRGAGLRIGGSFAAQWDIERFERRVRHQGARILDEGPLGTIVGIPHV